MQRLSKPPIQGKVAALVSARELVVNLGLQAGVTSGMVFSVLDEPLIVLDPDTREPLDILIHEKCRVRVTELRDRVCICHFLSRRETACEPGVAEVVAAREPGRDQINVGDLVVQANPDLAGIADGWVRRPPEAEPDRTARPLRPVRSSEAISA